MNMYNFPLKTCLLLACILPLCHFSLAHNGKVAHAYPLGKISIDGDFSDWPQNAVKYKIGTMLSETKPASDSDFSGFFQVGYSADNRSLYIAFTIIDDDFIEDTSANVRFNTQDCLELCLDGRHLPFGSGVASFMYSQKLRNTNHAYFDSFAKAAKWDIMQVAVKRNGNARYYEWQINLGEQFGVGKSVGLDVNVFDKDTDGSFTIGSWGKGGFKFRIPGNLGDVLLLPANQTMSTITGQVAWDRQMTSPLPGTVKLTDAQNHALWLTTEIDSLGNYAAEVPVGKYQVMLPENFFYNDNRLYPVMSKKPVTVIAKPGQRAGVEKLLVSSTPVPDLIPEKGVLHEFNPTVSKKVDQFIESYQNYYGIPGVSLALIKDGKVVYHKTYGVKNTITREKVDANTLFEAASITKPVFSFAVQKLAERGIIDLDKPLYLYLPYPDIAYDERYKLITARHVLTHRTGFPNWRWMNQDGKLNLRFTPGTDYNYSGEGFEYLKMVVEKITGKKVEQVLKEEVLDPVGLYHTFFSRNDS
ncbi:MAG TPA: serine hydrolase, partial [Flavitalea sp.]|nr:serine hydrolase [Flavitalea sp.]